MRWSTTILAGCAVLVALTATGLTGCLENGLPARPPIRDPEYSIAFYNATQDELNDVQATWQSNGVPCFAGAGYLPPDPTGHAVGASNAFQPDPIPDQVEVTWTTPDGAHHAQRVAVASKVPDLARFTGTIYLKYVGARWKVVAISKAERNRRAEEGEPPVPPKPGADPATVPDAATAQSPSSKHAVSPGTSRPATTQPAAGEQAAILDSLKLVHLVMMRAELLPLGDYCQSADPATQKYIQASSRIATAAHGLADAVRTRFGAKALEEMNLDLPDAGQVLKEGWKDLREAGDPLPGELEKATVDVQGDRATIHAGTESMTARRVGGKWKIELPSLAQVAAAEGLAGNPQADPRVMARAAEAEAITDERLAMDVRAGQFRTAAQVAEARASRRSAAGEILRGEVDGKPGPTTSPVR